MRLDTKDHIAYDCIYMKYTEQTIHRGKKAEHKFCMSKRGVKKIQEEIP